MAFAVLWYLASIGTSSAVSDIVAEGGAGFQRDAHQRYLELHGSHGHAGLEQDVSAAGVAADEWVVEIWGDRAAADVLAGEIGCKVIAQLTGIPNTYRLHKIHHGRSKRSDPIWIERQLAGDKRVVWAQRQFGKRREKRGFLRATHRGLTDDASVKGAPVSVDESSMRAANTSAAARFNDPLWDSQWYFHDSEEAGAGSHPTLNVQPVYDSGLTGRGVTVSILDDGIEHTHSDLAANYDPTVSYDLNDNDADPSPKYGSDLVNSHGTRCAGEVAMIADNKKCGVGVAHGASIGGVRMLDGAVTDAVEAMSALYGQDQVDIYCASWGPSDDGNNVEGPGKLAQRALYLGTTNGRQGKGAVYVWAAGNGGSKGDNCNCDGYVSSVFTLAVGSASQRATFPWYGEKCASTMAVTLSSGASARDPKVATTDLKDQCTSEHTGTSAAAPLAAGIIALALEANSNLTWRDVQHITAWTSDPEPLIGSEGWQRNGAGLRFNLRFGFGLMNAGRFVETAAGWTTVPAKHICIEELAIKNETLAFDQPSHIQWNSRGCRGTGDEVNFLEHVEVIATIEYPVRGVLEIDLVSPFGTRTQVLQPRENDRSDDGFINWSFMSVHTWGENPSGIWQFIVSDKTSEKNQSLRGKVIQAHLILHGTAQTPQHMKDVNIYNNGDFVDSI